jgi:glycosyltransferase involved in cell wall biosynthesis
MKLEVSVLIMTQNEEANIKFAVESALPYFNQIILVDSFSTDNTIEIVKQYPGVEVYQHAFENWAAQRNWMLRNCAIKNDIVFFLDADEYITAAFVDELRNIINSGIIFSAIFVTPTFIFLDKKLRHAYGHPKIRRIFRKTGLEFYCEGARERAVAEGPVLEIKEPFIHHDRKPISDWIAKHNVNAQRETSFYCERESVMRTASLPRGLRARTWVRENIWNRLPLLVRPFLYFFYRYIIKLGLLDGKAGFIYCYLHAFWYQRLIDIMIIEKSAKYR